jgi:hypothetical protein
MTTHHLNIADPAGYDPSPNVDIQSVEASIEQVLAIYSQAVTLIKSKVPGCDN